MKRLNTYLLTNYPLLWNLRIHLIWPLIVVLHLLFFFWGFGNAENIAARQYRRLAPDGEVVTIAILTALVVLIFWLALYFRNNAFKSFYPLRRGRLALEILLVFTTAFGLVSVAESYRAGGAMHIRQRGWGVDIEAERTAIELADHFLPFYLERFSRFNNCNLPSTTVRTDDGVGIDTFSYLNYCGRSDYMDDEEARRLQLNGNTGRAHRWLRNGNRDSVEWALREYLKIVRKNGGDYNFDPASHAAAIFSRPGFELQYTIRSNRAYEDDNPALVDGTTETEVVASVESGAERQAPELKYGTKFAYIEQSKAENTLSLIEQARLGAFRQETVTILLYFALGLTILVAGFRLTGLRTWGIAVIGAILWVIIIGLGIAALRGSEASLLFVLILEAIFTGVAVFLIVTNGRQRFAGVFYLWSLAGMPFVLPLLWLWLQEITERSYYSGNLSDPSGSPYVFLQTYQDWCMLVNVGVSLLLILGCYIPLARKWQAMAVE